MLHTTMLQRILETTDAATILPATHMGNEPCLLLHVEGCRCSMIRHSTLYLAPEDALCVDTSHLSLRVMSCRHACHHSQPKERNATGP